MKKITVQLVFCFVVAALLAALFKLDEHGGWYAARAFLTGKGSLWYRVTPGASGNPPWMNEALGSPQARATPGRLTIGPVEEGAEAGELPVILNGKEVDRIYILRFSPKRFAISVNNDPRGGKQTGEWLKAMRAVAMINGSYYARDGAPSTPTVSNGAALGPKEYTATNGAFVSAGGELRILNMAGQNWKTAFVGASQAFVSFPLLVWNGKAVENKANPLWLANRSFIGVDEDGRVLLGTTDTGYFSLPNLARFLGSTPLRLTAALNLDGGPVACQAASFEHFSRDFCGAWEIAGRDAALYSLKPVIPGARWNLPIAIGVVRR